MTEYAPVVNKHPVSCECVPLSFSLLGREMVNVEAQLDSYLGGTKNKMSNRAKFIWKREIQMEWSSYEKLLWREPRAHLMLPIVSSLQRRLSRVCKKASFIETNLLSYETMVLWHLLTIWVELVHLGLFLYIHIWLSLPTGLSGWSPGCHSNVKWPTWFSKCLILRSCTDNFIKAILFLKSSGVVWLPHSATFILCPFCRAGAHFSLLLLDITCITEWSEKLKGIPITSTWQHVVRHNPYQETTVSMAPRPQNLRVFKPEGCFSEFKHACLHIRFKRKEKWVFAEALSCFLKRYSFCKAA